MATATAASDSKESKKKILVMLDLFVGIISSYTIKYIDSQLIIVGKRYTSFLCIYFQTVSIEPSIDHSNIMANFSSIDSILRS